ncbi:conserved hypothetical protein, secreted [Candidatus Magnetomorum sp. HK-1]|nr:conserved hypothetical protein, secreted [Candidatus Magnetomorum sp. HK-1]
MIKCIVFMSLMLLPIHAFSMDPITDDEMNNITGAVGVHIYVEGEDHSPTYQVLQWQIHGPDNKTKRSKKNLNLNINDIYEISYEDCELRLDTGKTEQDGLWIKGKEVVTGNRSFVKIGSPQTAPDISADNFQLTFKDGNSIGKNTFDMRVSIPKTPDAIYISPR